ncbi:MAG: protein kinase domain-containing protein [Longimicrobiales bacterium]
MSKPPNGEDRSHPSEGAAYTDLPEHYVVEREIGRGGMGTVLRAQDVKHGRRVAIKILRPEVAHAFGKDRFLREIRTVANLVHPNIVPVLDSGETRDTLYFVMPYIEGESLRERLDRDHPMELNEALRITGEVVGALAYAHGQDVVHRDIKPENIILSHSGHAWLVDFGVARNETGNLRLTSTGLIIGSPLYASPEQTTDATAIDGRSDLYSMGCVLYEMLTGAPPFTGPTMQSVLVQHHTKAAPPLRALRPDLPAALEQLINRTLEKEPHQRFASAEELHAVLRAVLQSQPNVDAHRAPRLRVSRRAFWLAFAGAAASAVVVTALPGRFSPVRWLRPGSTTPPSDTRYAILAFELDSGVTALGAEDRLADALATWIGIDVVEPRRVRALPASRGATNFDVNAAAVRAREVGARRFVHGRISRKDDSLRVNLEVGDALRPNVTLHKIRLGLLSDLRDADRHFRDLADSLVLRGLAPECVAGGPATRHLSAIHACDAAFSALADGDLAVADSLLQQALQHDSNYGRASLWLAELRGWIVPAPPDTRSFVIHALADSSRLTAREAMLARAQIDLADGQFARACAIYRGLIDANAQDHVAWLGLGECHRRDNVVLRDARSASRWSFRSSYHQAVQAYQRAFELQPALMGGYRDRSFAAIRELFLTSTTSYRSGIGPNRERLIAFPSWTGDSLAFAPIPEAAFSQGLVGSVPATLSVAIDRQRIVLRALAARWSSMVPLSLTASEARAVAYEIAGDSRVIGALQQARSLASTANDRLRLASAEVWARVKFGIPDRPDQMARAKSLADSLVSNINPQTAEEAGLLVPLAALTGRRFQAALWARHAAEAVASRTGFPTGIVEPARALLVFSAMGGPVDSIIAMETLTERSISNGIAAAKRAEAQSALLTRAAMLAFPVHAFQSLHVLQSGPVIRAQVALLQGDSAAARRILTQANAVRIGAGPAHLTLDVLYAEARLLSELGDHDDAIRRLDPTLNALQWLPPGQLSDVGHVASLLRALALRMELAARAGDRESARRWGAALAVFLPEADSTSQPSASRSIGDSQGRTPNSRN